MNCHRVFFTAMAAGCGLLLSACGGGSSTLPEVPEQVVQPYTQAAAPIVSYHPYATPSNIYEWGNTIYIGGDLEPREALREIQEIDGVKYYLGHSRDGVGVSRLENFEYDLITENDTVHPLFSDSGFFPFDVQPRLWLDPRFVNDEEALGTLLSSVFIVNDALPPEYQILFSGTLEERPFVNEGDIFVELLPPAVVRSLCDGGVACAINTTHSLPYPHTYSARILFPDDIEIASYAQEVLVHEFLHAMGIQGHVDSIEFPDSIMGAVGDFFPNPGFTMHRVDREILQIMYMSKITELYNDWSEWSDTSLHIVGRANDDSFNFGTAWFNGLPQPWARGVAPLRSLSDNPRLFGTVSWDGAFVGFSGPSPLAGDVQLRVNLNMLNQPQDLSFRDIYYFSRYEETGPNRWFPARNLDYKVTMAENSFFHISPEGQIMGSFFGLSHEAMGGTLKRTDMVGAFGGKR